MDLKELKTSIVWFLMTFWYIDLGQLMSNLSISNIWKQKYGTIKHLSVAFNSEKQLNFIRHPFSSELLQFYRF